MIETLKAPSKKVEQARNACPVNIAQRRLRNLYKSRGFPDTSSMSIENLAAEYWLLTALVGTEFMTQDLHQRYVDVTLGCEVAAFCGAAF